MTAARRVLTITLVIVTSALTAAGLVFAATDSNATSNPSDSLALNGIAPQSSELHVSISTSQSYSASATVTINFATNAIEANVQVPMVASSSGVDVRLVDHHVYVAMANLSALFGASWLSAPVKQPSLQKLAEEMLHPDVAHVRGFTHATITKNGSSTTYSYRRNNVVVASPAGLALHLPAHVSLTLTVTTGSQGELTASSFSATSAHSSISINSTVLAYNQSAQISVPPTRMVKPLDRSIVRQLLGTSPLATLLTPRGLTSLGMVQLN